MKVYSILYMMNTHKYKIKNSPLYNTDPTRPRPSPYVKF